MSKKLPIPAGYRILLKPREILNKTAGGIILTDKSREDQSYLNSIGQVIVMGPECYSDRKKPWCKVGDWILYGRYAGAKISVQNVKMVLINDDEVLGTLENPDIVSRNI